MSGVGLDTAFNQDEPQQNINTHAKKDKTPDGLEKKSPKGATPLLGNRNDPVTDGQFKGHAEQSSATRFRNFDDTASEDEREDAYRGTDYTMDKIGNAAQKTLNLERIQHAKVGETVSYNATTGTIVRKDGSYVTIYNEGNNAFDQVHAGTTSISTDTIGSGITSQLWDQMRQEQRVASLSKAGIQEPLHFISRKWSELPMNLKDVLKLKPTRNTPSSPTRNQEPLGGSDDSGSPYKKPKFNEYDPEHNDLEWSGQGPGNQINSNEDKNKNILKVNPTSRGEPGEKMPGTASNTGNRGTLKPGGRTSTGGQGSRLNSGQERKFKPGNKVPVKVDGKTIMVTERQRDKINAKNGQETPVKTTPTTTTPPTEKSPSYTSVGSGYKGTVPEGASRDKPTQPQYGTTTGQTRGTGQTASTTDKITNKPSGNVRASGSGPGGPTGASSRSARGSRAADRASTRSTSSGSNTPRQPEGVTFATGLDKATNYSDLATALYRIRNNLNKVKLPDSITSQVKFPRDHLGEPDDKEAQNPRSNEHNSHNTDSGGQLGSKDSFKIKVESSTPKGPGFGKIEDIDKDATGTGDFGNDGHKTHKERVAGSTGTREQEANNGAFDNALSSPKNSKGKDIISDNLDRTSSSPQSTASSRQQINDDLGSFMSGKPSTATPPTGKSPKVVKSDVEHGAYGGVVTDTPFDAPEDYEEDREDVHGKEFDHNHQQKTPKDFGVPQAKDTKKEGGSVTTGTPGTNNPVNSGKKQPGAYDPKYDPDEDGYKEKAIVNKNNTRYGTRQVTKEEAMEIWKKSGIKPSKPKLDTNLLDHGGDYVEESEDGPHGGRNRDFAED